MSPKRNTMNVKNPDEIDLIGTIKPSNFSTTAKKVATPASTSYLVQNKKSFSTISNAVRGIEYENSVLNHMENLKKRQFRHATVNDISQLYASDVSSLKKLNISELN